ncbi:MAG: single-stranded-DNA-specific exonuclease RecJ [Candidatus Nomurabacteria bacterium]|jgi:single-stranded-DNA-specific exonuclease|nr:single-stranded-DNA-specific exonuclease RecJ [Candidatus Nomurabacteria bacterium]
MPRSKIFTKLLENRGLVGDSAEAFLKPDYLTAKHDPFLLPDMKEAVERVKLARTNHEKVVIYGDYDIDGISATAILSDSLGKFGLDVDTYTPDRFTEGYGLNEDAVRHLAEIGAKLAITVDCGSLSHAEIGLANELGLDVIVTDHHTVAETMPPAVAVVNPHRLGSSYPFSDLAGCGVAFKLVQALQTELNGLPDGHEKWLLDLVALGTVCDIVALQDENRNNVYWGIEVLKKTRRLGLRALMAVSKARPEEIDARKIGFALGPRLNAAGRLETAKYALELLLTDNSAQALELAQKLDNLNHERRTEQDRIFTEAVEKIGVPKDSVLVVGDESWNEGVIGIVASKLVEKFGRPAFVLSIGEHEAKGSGRSFGDFSLAEAIHATKDKYLLRGGGHAAAGGVTLEVSKIDAWRQALGDCYKKLGLGDQSKYLLATEDIQLDDLTEVNLGLVEELSQLEPFGMGNEKPIFRLNHMIAKYVDRIGRDGSHLKLTVEDKHGSILKFLAFSPPEHWFIEPGSKISVWVNLETNEWNGQKSVEGRILRLEQL